MQVDKLSVIIPVYNEERTVIEVLQKVMAVQLPAGISREIIVVNDASSDNSKQRIEDFITSLPVNTDIVLLNHPANKGKGGSVHTALKKISGDYFIIQDADLELDPDDFNALLQPVLENRSEIVFGSRFLNSSKNHSSLSLSFVANKFLTGFSNLVFGTRLTDMETCYKLVPAAAMTNVVLKEERFGFEPEITARLSQMKKLRMVEVPVSYHARSNLQGKKIGWKDGIRAVWCIVKYGILNR